jgi:hypothetical protein
MPAAAAEADAGDKHVALARAASEAETPEAAMQACVKRPAKGRRECVAWTLRPGPDRATYGVGQN